MIVASNPSAQPLTSANGYGVDASGWFLTDGSGDSGNVLDGQAFGLTINGATQSWEPVSVGNHVYVTDFVSSGTAG